MFHVYGLGSGAKQRILARYAASGVWGVESVQTLASDLHTRSRADFLPPELTSPRSIRSTASSPVEVEDLRTLQ